jgi:NAD(P)-dependent dehydrogenase (short-subunit alcohol dehydrogenase family)
MLTTHTLQLKRRPTLVVPSFSLKGKVAIITGGKRGIGKAIALGFAEAGADVASCSRTIEDGQLQALAEEIQRLGRRSLAIQADVTQKTDVDNMVQQVVSEFGKIDILVNNAGIMIRKPLLELSEEEWDATLDINLKGYFLCSQAVARVMKEHGGGRIINVASVAGFEAILNSGIYCISKAGVIMATKVMARELAQYNIRVNAIAPGETRTRLSLASVDPEWGKEVADKTPLGRIAEPDEMVGAMIYLASDASSFVTGETIVVDGGLSLYGAE